MPQKPNKKEFTNSLINESSPYLLQHAHNPVDWMPWGEKALEKANAENKPLLISIGYSACHWCHVMEHESFEDSIVANLMNKHFVNIKVDREERPDIDNIYMDAVQLMTGRGGWPLNCFATPDGRPFFGGTYFPKDNWIDILTQISNLYKTENEKVEEYANKLMEGIVANDLVKKKENVNDWEGFTFNEGISKWVQSFDNKYGGPNRAPKFPLPNSYSFLLNYNYYKPNKTIADHISLTLEKMALGGIYDQVGGGFSRYSTDELWKAPHFEKMLYDNAQLISLYSKAYRWNKNSLYKSVVFETIDFLERELLDNSGGFYSALDADSEGEEGKFYVWSKEELKTILGSDFAFASDYYEINANGLWEHKNYILLREKTDSSLAKKLGISVSDVVRKSKKINELLLKERSNRIRPGLDDKILSSWNGLTLIGLSDAYMSFGDKKHKDLALACAEFIAKNQLQEDGSMFHNYKSGKPTIMGFLEDYCFVINGFIKTYQISADEKWLGLAEKIANYCIENFYSKENGMFFFTNQAQDKLISRKTEIQDNVISSSNSEMANSLYTLGSILQNEEYLSISNQMLNNVKASLNTYLPSYCNWANLLLKKQNAQYEVVISGENTEAMLLELHQEFLPEILVMPVEKESKIPLLEGKYTENTRVYVCLDKVCKLPVVTAKEAIEQIR